MQIECLSVREFMVARFGNLVIGMDGHSIRIELMSEALGCIDPEIAAELRAERKRLSEQAWYQENKQKRIADNRAWRARKRLAAQAGG